MATVEAKQMQSSSNGCLWGPTETRPAPMVRYEAAAEAKIDKIDGGGTAGATCARGPELNPAKPEDDEFQLEAHRHCRWRRS